MEEPTTPRTSILLPGGNRVALGESRDSLVGRHVQQFFEPYRIGQAAREALASNCRVRGGSRDKSWVLGGSRRIKSPVVFLISGCVMVRSWSGHTDRLWKGPAFFGDEEVWNYGRSDIRNSRIYTLSDFRALIMSASKLKEIAMEEPTLAFALLRMSAERRAVAESVYGQNKKSPIARVATLLDHLATPRAMPGETMDENGETVVRLVVRHRVDGPTQTDLADALGLGRATVEKALATLRKEGALKKAAPGSRQNRVYEIADRDLLREIALDVHL